MLDKASYTPLYIQVREYILNRIRMGDYKAGDRLPTEKELMEQLQVGRATVRAALNELEHEGQVEKRHGIGTFVKEPITTSRRSFMSALPGARRARPRSRM